MIVVIDNSVFVPLFLEDEDSSVAEQIFADETLDLHVPALFGYEFGNALLVCLRRKRLTEEDVVTARGVIHEAGFVMAPAPSPHQQEQIHQLAVTHQLSFYDAAYLLLAIEEKGRLATLDKQLRKAALAEGAAYN